MMKMEHIECSEKDLPRVKEFNEWGLLSRVDFDYTKPLLEVGHVNERVEGVSTRLNYDQTDDARAKLALVQAGDFAKELCRRTVLGIFGQNIGSMIAKPPRTKEQIVEDEKNLIEDYVVNKFGKLKVRLS